MIKYVLTTKECHIVEAMREYSQGASGSLPQPGSKPKGDSRVPVSDRRETLANVSGLKVWTGVQASLSAI